MRIILFDIVTGRVALLDNVIARVSLKITARLRGKRRRFSGLAGKQVLKDGVGERPHGARRGDHRRGGDLTPR